MSMQKKLLSAAVLMALGTGAAQAAAVPTYLPTNTTGNNFTMVAGAGGLTGGTNDVTFTWDGTLNNTEVTNGGSNATLSSPTPFFGKVWTAHHVNMYGPGTYTFNVGGTAAENVACNGTVECTTGAAYALTVPTGYIGAHMLFNWSTSVNIDVVQLYKVGGDSWLNDPSTGPFCAAPLTQGQCHNNPNPNGNSETTVFSLLSTDTSLDTDAYHGTKMIDGPFSGQSANFNVMANMTPVPVPAAVWLMGSGLVGLVGVARRKKKA